MSTSTRVLGAGAVLAAAGVAGIAFGKPAYVAPDGAMAATGADFPWWVFLLVGLTLVGAVVLLFLGGRRKRAAGPADADDVVVPARSAGPSPAAPARAAVPEPVVDGTSGNATTATAAPKPAVDPDDTALFSPEADDPKPSRAIEEPDSKDSPGHY